MQYYYKVIKKTMRSHAGNVKYKIGLNVDPLPFNDNPKECEEGGIYFTDKENIKYYIYGTLLCKLYVPDEYPIVGVYDKNCDDINKYKAHAIYIEEMHNIASVEGLKWAEKEGIDIDPFITYLTTSGELYDDVALEYYDKIAWSQEDIRNRVFVSNNIYYNLSEDALRKLIELDVIDLDELVEFKQLSYQFLEDHADLLDLEIVSLHQYLSEDFIAKFQDRLDWYSISCSQNLSLRFINKFKDKIILSELRYNGWVYSNPINKFIINKIIFKGRK